MVLDSTATIGIAGSAVNVPAGIERIGVGSVEAIPVAAPDHPLALAGQNAPGAGRNHIQLVLTARSLLTQGQDFGVVGTQTWRLGDLGAKHMLLRAGIGWGYMPEPMVREDLEKGWLVQLDMPELKGGPMVSRRSTGRIRPRALPAPGSFPGSRLRPRARRKPSIRSILSASRDRSEGSASTRE
jgi:DNA-binding transcriptional LysR family regulator